MTIPQTRQQAVSAPPCPPWCQSHDGYDLWLHCSDWRTWSDPDWADADDDLSFAFQAVRHDMVHNDGLHIGSIDFNVRVDVAENAYMCCDSIRGFAQFLLTLAAEFDPHNLNGEPLEWHTPVRQPLLGRDR
jgi:hypothetical protein